MSAERRSLISEMALFATASERVESFDRYGDIREDARLFSDRGDWNTQVCDLFARQRTLGSSSIITNASNKVVCGK